MEKFFFLLSNSNSMQKLPYEVNSNLVKFGCSGM
jgi:hypothetical protein